MRIRVQNSAKARLTPKQLRAVHSPLPGAERSVCAVPQLFWLSEAEHREHPALRQQAELKAVCFKARKLSSKAAGAGKQKRTPRRCGVARLEPGRTSVCEAQEVACSILGLEGNTGHASRLLSSTTPTQIRLWGKSNTVITDTQF